ncbi:MAG: hypothetical protein ACYSUD_21480, partial [Planctomycetota bacterium]
MAGSRNLSDLPSVNEVLRRRGVARLIEQYGRQVVTYVVRAAIQAARERAGKGDPVSDAGTITADIEDRLKGICGRSLKR